MTANSARARLTSAPARSPSQVSMKTPAGGSATPVTSPGRTASALGERATATDTRVGVAIDDARVLFEDGTALEFPTRMRWHCRHSTRRSSASCSRPGSSRCRRKHGPSSPAGGCGCATVSTRPTRTSLRNSALRSRSGHGRMATAGIDHVGYSGVRLDIGDEWMIPSGVRASSSKPEVLDAEEPSEKTIPPTGPSETTTGDDGRASTRSEQGGYRTRPSGPPERARGPDKCATRAPRQRPPLARAWPGWSRTTTPDGEWTPARPPGGSCRRPRGRMRLGLRRPRPPDIPWRDATAVRP